MSRYTVSRQARRDLKEISQYIAADSPAAAYRWLASLEEKFKFLATQPHAGERRPDLGDAEYRVFSAGNYVIFYRLRGRTVVISHIRHGARDWGKLP
jgi:toxin ParE1/3/4